MADPIIPENTTPKPTATEPVLPRLRTYAADMSEAIRERGASLASIVNAEKVAPQKDVAPQKGRGRTIVMGLAALFLIVLGIAAVITAFVIMGSKKPPTVTTSIIYPNQTVAAAVTPDESLSKTLAAIRTKQDLSLGEVARIIVTEDGVPLEGSSLARTLGLPEDLAREVTDTMVGIHSFDRNQPFLILSVKAYDRSFNAMLVGERALAGSLGPFFAPLKGGTPPPLSFSDAVLENLDVRRSQNTWPIIYTFPEQGLLIITTNEFTLKEVIARLSSVRR